MFIGDEKRKGEHTSNEVVAKKTNYITVSYEATKVNVHTENSRKIKLDQVRAGK